MKDAKSEVVEEVYDGIVLGYTDNEIIVRRHDAIYVCIEHESAVNKKIVATTLNHYMGHDALMNLKKLNQRTKH